MHRATPLNTSQRAYSSGGARTTIDKADDKKLMQESGGGVMKGEKRSKVESPQNYGFTSVVNPADKDKDGKVTGSAEGFVSFMGGNRSFPVTTVMDDRRHRLKELEPGDTAMYGSKEWGQQFLVNKEGMFLTGNEEGKKVRLQLVKNSNGEQQQQSKSESAAKQSAGEQKQKATGQKTLHKETSSTFVDMTSSMVHTKRGNGQVKVEDKRVMNFYEDEKKSMVVDDKHVHIRFGKMRIWVNEKGCFSTVPIQVVPDED